jgi:cell division septation protein DedD
MATARRTSDRTRKPAAKRSNDGFLAWTVTLVGGLMLVVAGFSSGVLLGVMTEEPKLVTGHLAGRSESVPWTIAAQPAGDAPESLTPSREAQPAAPTQVAAAVTPPVNEAPVSPAPVKRAPAPSLPDVAAPPPSGFAIQVGAFSSSDAARAMIAKLGKQGYKSYVAAGAAARDGRWRVRIGPFATREAADKKAADIKREQQLPTWVLSEEG